MERYSNDPFCWNSDCEGLFSLNNTDRYLHELAEERNPFSNDLDGGGTGSQGHDAAEEAVEDPQPAAPDQADDGLAATGLGSPVASPSEPNANSAAVAPKPPREGEERDEQMEDKDLKDIKEKCAQARSDASYSWMPSTTLDGNGGKKRKTGDSENKPAAKKKGTLTVA